MISKIKHGTHKKWHAMTNIGAINSKYTKLMGSQGLP